MKSIGYERGRSLRKIHDRKLFYISDTRGCSLRMFTEKFTTQILWHIAPGDSAISEHLLMGKTCAGSEYSKSSEHLGPRDILVDMTLVL
jgi:hypothetical protein